MNRDGGGKPGRHSPRAGRQVSEEEAALWEELGRSLDKVKKKPRVTAHGDSGEGGPSGLPSPRSDHHFDPAHRAPQRGRTKPSVPSGSPARDRFPPMASRPPAPAEIDRRTLRQVGTGKVPIDAVLDLHGMTQEAAHSRLRGFLMSCQAKGHRLVLVITGKGTKAERPDGPNDHWAAGARRGVLRRSVPIWLDEPELRAVVVSYASAGVRHGGEGALYIRLRKARHG